MQIKNVHADSGAHAVSDIRNAWVCCTVGPVRYTLYCSYEPGTRELVPLRGGLRYRGRGAPLYKKGPGMRAQVLDSAVKANAPIAAALHAARTDPAVVAAMLACVAAREAAEKAKRSAEAAAERMKAAAPRLLEALRFLQASPNDPRAHRAALDAIALAEIGAAA